MTEMKRTAYISLVLTRAEDAQLERLMADLGKNRSDTVRTALRELAERRGIPTLDVIMPCLDGSQPPPEMRKHGETKPTESQPNSTT